MTESKKARLSSSTPADDTYMIITHQEIEKLMKSSVVKAMGEFETRVIALLNMNIKSLNIYQT